MDPVTFVLGLLVVTGCLHVTTRVVADGIATVRAAKAGQWDLIDRDRARRAEARQGYVSAWGERRRRRHEQAGGDGGYRPGARDYLGDVYHGVWEDQLAKRRAKRAARPDYVFDPDAPRLRDRVDAAVTEKVQRVRVSRGWAVAKRVGRALVDPVGEPKPVAEPPAAEPTDVPSPDAVPQQTDSSTTDQPDPSEEPTMTAPTTTAAAQATEVNNNEDARRSFQQMADAAGEAQEALVMLETARAKMAAAAQGTADGMSAKSFDVGATSAASEAVDAIGLDTLAGWAEKIDAVRGAADKGLASLDKYRDAEAQVAEERIDPTVLASTSS